MKSRLQLTSVESIHFDYLIDDYKKKGIMPIIYAKKILSEEQYNNYMDSYKSIQSSI